MPKITVKIIKGFEIKKGSKYILVLPRYMVEEGTEVGAALTKLFQDADSEFVGLVPKDIEDIKIMQVPQKKGKK